MSYRSVLIAALFAAVAAWQAPAFAGAKDYKFEPVNAEVRQGDGVTLAVRLLHSSTGKPVAGAIVFRTRLDMSPDDMMTMTAKHQSLPEVEPGVYRFKADLTMAGGWALKLMAKVQGEPETIIGTVIFAAKN